MFKIENRLCYGVTVKVRFSVYCFLSFGFETISLLKRLETEQEDVVKSTDSTSLLFSF